MNLRTIQAHLAPPDGPDLSSDLARELADEALIDLANVHPEHWRYMLARRFDAVLKASGERYR